MFSMPVESKEIIGWLEMIRVYPGNLKLRAKMDTGAKGSAINVYNLKKFDREKTAWVSFELRDKSKKTNPKQIFVEKKVIDTSLNAGLFIFHVVETVNSGHQGNGKYCG